jgi:class 3 adenylate cyclase
VAARSIPQATVFSRLSTGQLAQSVAVKQSQMLKSLKIQVRVGIHTGECEVIGESLGDIAVHIGARILSPGP